jgi:VIT1/CCC1 family predicted Fe2+/Mn2+ transporter
VPTPMLRAGTPDVASVRRPPGQLVRGILSPFERASEILFGLIMALTITGALSVAQATEHETRALFASTLACNIAWGLVDGVLYVFNALVERGRRRLLTLALQGNADGVDVSELLAEVLPGRLLERLTPAEVHALRERFASQPGASERPRVRGRDVLGAVAVFLLVTASTFPVSLPFLLVRDPAEAMAISRGLSLLLLFFSGYAVGRYAGLRPVWVGLSTLAIGAVLVGVVKALGG